MHLNRLLRLQLLYCFLGIIFNLISWWTLRQEGEGFVPTNPVVGLGVMILYGLCLIPGKIRRLTLYRILMSVAIILFGYGGIIKHLIALTQSPELYPSLSIGIIAILINVFGFVLNVYAALGKYNKP